MLAPIFEQLAETYKDNQIKKLDIDAEGALP